MQLGQKRSFKRSKLPKNSGNPAFVLEVKVNP